MKIDDRPDSAKRLEKARVSRNFHSASDAAKYFGWNKHTYIQHENGLRGFNKAADKYARAFRVSEAWLLTGEGEAPPAPKLPVQGIAAGSVTGHNVMHNTPIDYVVRPPALENVPDAYALWVRGKSMEPAFREGALVIVHPYKQPLPGDDVIIQQSTNGEIAAFIKRLVRRENGNVICEQFNPPAQISYPEKSIIALHKVLPLNELLGN